MNVIFHQAALGDWVLTFPWIAAMTGPTTIVAPASKAQLAAHLFKHVQPCDIESFSFDRASWLANASRIISFIGDGHDAWSERARRASPDARFLFVRHKPPAEWTRHVTDWHLMQLRDQGMTLETISPAMRDNQRGPIVIHPGAGSHCKCWPAERFEALMERLRADGHTALAVLGEVEMEQWPKDILTRWRTRWNAVTPGTLIELAECLASAKVYLGNDAGPTHLAAQLGVRTVALFGPTDARVWSPQGPAVRVIAPPSPCAMDWITIDAVYRTVSRLLAERA